MFKSKALFQNNRIYEVQNFEQHQGEDSTKCPGDSYFSTLAMACPRLKTVKLNLSCESDGYIRHLAGLNNLEEVILDFPGPLGAGFRHFFHSAGASLTQLGLTLREVAAADVHLLSQHCPSLRVLHLFFIVFQVEEGREHPGKVLFPNLESLYLGVGRDSSLNQVHTLITDRLLTWCRKLRTLYMSGVSPRVNDSYLEARLQQGSLHSLESCTIKEDAQLTRASYLGLMKHCPALRMLNMSSWNIPRKDFLVMQKEAEDLNLDLVLIGGKV